MENTLDIESLRFPIGKYFNNKNPDKTTLENWIRDIELFPSRLIEITQNLSIVELNWKYRPDGWSIKQVVHHCSDSHMHSLTRFKLALTENKPTIKPYFEEKWAELIDGTDDNIQDSLMLLKALHSKWVKILKTLSADELKLEFVHPEHGAVFNLAETIGNYAWHSNHHLAHVKLAIEYKGKFN
jgi:hypothetical protein